MSISEIEKVFEIKKALTKEQITFKKRVEDIKNLRNDLEALSSSIPAARAEFANKTIVIRTAIKSLIKQKIQLLEEGLFEKKLGKKQKESLAEVIVLECMSYLDGEEDPEVEAILTRVQESKPKEEKEADEKLKAFFESHSSHFDQDGSSQTQSGFQKKNKKEQAKEEARKRSIRDIYKDLIKLCHPDKLGDDVNRIDKEELAKEINAAYKNNDLLKLLEVELMLMQANQNRITEMAKEKLNVYNDVLLQQKQQLERELWQLKNENEFVYRNLCMKNSQPKKFIKTAIDNMGKELEMLQFELAQLKTDKNFIKIYIARYIEQLDDLF